MSLVDEHKVYHALLVEQSSSGDIRNHFQFDMEEKDVKIIIDHFNKFEEFKFDGLTFYPAYVSKIEVYLGKLSAQYGPNGLDDKWDIIKRSCKSVNDDFKVKRYDQSLLEDFKFAKRQMMINSIDKVHDFCKTMITLVSGFFAAYFALLKFLGGDNPLHAIDSIILWPPALFIVSIIVLIFGAKPHIFFGNPSDVSRLKRFRRNIILWKYVPMIVGMGLFLCGLGFTMLISTRILLSPTTGT